ncbi:hypothetical protein SDC9_140781 [bioreactor metagenome]|uniref:Uncharacterized protein n=1 Tax=bioreactor metagenome TaxID=1076179 RepID=A0A645DWE6_9ZZZZ
MLEGRLQHLLTWLAALTILRPFRIGQNLYPGFAAFFGLISLEVPADEDIPVVQDLPFFVEDDGADAVIQFDLGQFVRNAAYISVIGFV